MGLEKSLESPLDCKEIQPVHPKGDQSWMFIGRTDAEAETPILWPPDVRSSHLKRPCCWERLKVGGEGDDRGWDGWMASPTQWTWVWVNSRSWWWTGRPGVLQFMGSQRVRHDWATELNWMLSTFSLVRNPFLLITPTSPCHYLHLCVVVFSFSFLKTLIRNNRHTIKHFCLKFKIEKIWYMYILMKLLSKSR